MAKIGFIGTGKMAGALISAILHRGIARQDEVLCSDVIADPLQKISEKYGVQIAKNNWQVLRECALVFLSFKPQNFPSAVEELADAVRPDQIFVSILAGVRIAKIRRYLPGKIVRVMPNTACLVGQMAAGYARADNVSPEEVAPVKKILESAGSAVEVEEEQLDAVTGLSGSGPAFVAYLLEAFIAAGAKAGLPISISRELALKTFSGTAELLSQWRMEPQELIRMVSSPHGTTLAGRHVLESSDVAKVIRKTILRAAERSRELGQ